MRFVPISCIVMLLTQLSAYAAPDPDLGAVALHQALLDIGTDLRLMCVATHPDDEDGATLTYYRKKFGYKTFAVIATRGEGGQNEIGSELYEELGVIRTHEMMRASEHTGAELHFLNYPEFGFSKSADEAFEVWGKQEALRRMVRKIRELKPDVIITHHDETSGHGHHQAVGRTLMEAFDLAGDPKAFPEELDVWQPTRLYWRDFTGEADGTVLVPFSELDPVRGVTYAKIAADALREHESQGMGFFIDRFLTSRSTARYTLMKEHKAGVQGGGEQNAPSAGLFAGLKDRVSKGERAIAAGGNAGIGGEMWNAYFSDPHAHESGDAVELDVLVSELQLTVSVSDSILVPGQGLDIDIEFRDHGEKDVEGTGFDAYFFPYDLYGGHYIKAPLNEDGTSAASISLKIPKNAKPTFPHAEHLFDEGFLEPQLTIYGSVESSIGGIYLQKKLFIDIAPPVGIEYLNAPYLLKRGGENTTVSLLLRNYTPDANEVTVKLTAPKGVKLSQNTLKVSFANEDEEKVVTIPVRVSPDLPEGDYAISATIAKNDYEAQGTLRVVDYTVPADINVGVIQSYDNTFLNTLTKMDIPHEALEKGDFTAARLDQFSTIIVDIRAYLVRPDLIANNQAVLDYVKRGGTLLVMYQKTFEWKKEYAPYPLRLSHNRVTREDASITLLQPKHPLFTTPNLMHASDWDGWRQERGLYFPAKWDAAYTPLIEVHDPGETPPPGSLLVADYGEGVYLYTALGWYRQLRELHPGTLRLFANMLAL